MMEDILYQHHLIALIFEIEYDVDGVTRDLCRMRDDAISCDTKYSRIYVGSLEPWNALFYFFLWSTFCV